MDIPESGGSDMGGTQPKDSKNLAGNRNSRLQSEIHWHRTGTHGNAVWDSLAGNRNLNSSIQRFIGWE